MYIVPSEAVVGMNVVMVYVTEELWALGRVIGYSYCLFLSPLFTASWRLLCDCIVELCV